MSEHAPTVQEARTMFASCRGCLVCAGNTPVHEAEFDRWLAEVERAAAEKAWADGRESFAVDLTKPPGPDGLKEATVNPYRRNEGETSES